MPVKLLTLVVVILIFNKVAMEKTVPPYPLTVIGEE
jgi:hypothetical protein